MIRRQYAQHYIRSYIDQNFVVNYYTINHTVRGYIFPWTNRRIIRLVTGNQEPSEIPREYRLLLLEEHSQITKLIWLSILAKAILKIPARWKQCQNSLPKCAGPSCPSAISSVQARLDGLPFKVSLAEGTVNQPLPLRAIRSLPRPPTENTRSLESWREMDQPVETVADEPCLYPSSPRPTPATGRKWKVVAKSLQKTLSETSMLVNFLPTGTLLTFEMLLPSVSGDGSCSPASTTMIHVLLGLCAISCFFFRFTDSFHGPDGKVYYGFVTSRGLAVFKPGLGVEVPNGIRRPCACSHGGDGFFLGDRIVRSPGHQLSIPRESQGDGWGDEELPVNGWWGVQRFVSCVPHHSLRNRVHSLMIEISDAESGWMKSTVVKRSKLKHRAN